MYDTENFREAVLTHSNIITQFLNMNSEQFNLLLNKLEKLQREREKE